MHWRFHKLEVAFHVISESSSHCSRLTVWCVHKSFLLLNSMIFTPLTPTAIFKIMQESQIAFINHSLTKADIANWPWLTSDGNHNLEKLSSKAIHPTTWPIVHVSLWSLQQPRSTHVVVITGRTGLLEISGRNPRHAGSEKEKNAEMRGGKSGDWSFNCFFPLVVLQQKHTRFSQTQTHQKKFFLKCTRLHLKGTMSTSSFQPPLPPLVKILKFSVNSLWSYGIDPYPHILPSPCSFKRMSARCPKQRKGNMKAEAEAEDWQRCLLWKELIS